MRSCGWGAAELVPLLSSRNPLVRIDADQRSRSGDLVVGFLPSADRGRIHHRVADGELVLLTGVEAVAVDGGTRLAAGLTDVGETGDRLGVLVQFVLVALVDAVEVLPPGRLGLPPMPLEEPGEELSALLVGRGPIESGATVAEEQSFEHLVLRDLLGRTPRPLPPREGLGAAAAHRTRWRTRHGAPPASHGAASSTRQSTRLYSSMSARIWSSPVSSQRSNSSIDEPASVIAWVRAPM